MHANPEEEAMGSPKENRESLAEYMRKAKNLPQRRQEKLETV